MWNPIRFWPHVQKDTSGKLVRIFLCTETTWKDFVSPDSCRLKAIPNSSVDSALPILGRKLTSSANAARKGWRLATRAAILMPKSWLRLSWVKAEQFWMSPACRSLLEWEYPPANLGSISYGLWSIPTMNSPSFRRGSSALHIIHMTIPSNIALIALCLIIWR